MKNLRLIKKYAIRICITIFILFIIALIIIFAYGLHYELQGPNDPRDITDYSKVEIDHDVTGIEDAIAVSEEYIKEYLREPTRLVSLEGRMLSGDDGLRSVESIFNIYDEKKGVRIGTANVNVDLKQNLIIHVLCRYDDLFPDLSTSANPIVLKDIMDKVVVEALNNTPDNDGSFVYSYILIALTDSAYVTIRVEYEGDDLHGEKDWKVIKYQGYDVVKYNDEYSLIPRQ